MGEAVGLMARVPLALDLSQVVPQLAALRAVGALVDLPLRVRCGAGGGGWVGTTGCEGCGSTVGEAQTDESLPHCLCPPPSPHPHSRPPHPAPPPQKAAALDPHGVAEGPPGGAEREAAAQRRYESCYQYPLAVLRLLIDRTGGGGGGAGWRAESGLSGWKAG